MTFFLLAAVIVVSDLGPNTAPSTTSKASSTTPSLSTSTAKVRPVAAAYVPAVCRTPARRGFIPKRATIALVGRDIPVLAMGRGPGRIPLPPPLTSYGKRSFAWDKYGPKPGSRHGNVRFNAHTYPDGSALGNKLLRRLWVGNRIIVRGRYSAICYRVTRRIVVSPLKIGAYYNTTASPKLAIVVCSGRRLGPGRWTKRTIWYAWPSTR
jgi:hypothetical protein